MALDTEGVQDQAVPIVSKILDTMGTDGADGWPWGPDETPRFRGHAVESRKVTTCPELRW